MKRYIWIFALLISAVPVFAQGPDDAEGRDLNIGGQFALGNLALRDLKPIDDPVQQLKTLFRGAKLPLTKEQEQKLDAIVETQRKDMQAVWDRFRADGVPVDTTRRLNQEYLKRVNAVLTTEQLSAWRHYRIEQIRLRGGFPALRLILEGAGVPLASGQESLIQKTFDNFAARRTRLSESNPKSRVLEIDRLVIAEFNRVVALLTSDQRRALEASRQVSAR